MKQCPQCKRIYADESLNYCLDDGDELLHGSTSLGFDTAFLPDNRTSEAPTRIQTGDVSGNTGESGRGERGDRRFGGYRSVWVGIIIMILAAGGFAVYRYFNSGSVRQINTVAVLPIVNESADADTEYLSDGLTESLIASLAQLPQLSVKARSSVFRYKGSEVDVKKAGSELGVEALLTGRMVRRGSDVRVDIELVDASTETVLWKGDYHRSMSDLAALEEDLSRDITGKLRTKLTGAETGRIAGLHTANADAYELYLRGQYLSADTEEHANKRIDYFNQAIAQDPQYALAHVALARAWMELGGVLGYSPPSQTYPAAHEALKKALAINPDLADVHGALADYYLVYEWDWQAAKNEFDTALRLDPNSSELHESYGMYLEALGRFEEAVSERETARKLDPMSPAVTADVGYPLYYARRQDEAIAYFRKGLELDPNYSWAHAWIGQSYLELKKYPEAIAEIDKAVDLSQGASRIIATRGFAFAVAGRRDDALKVLADLDALAKEKYVSPYFFAVIYAGLGEKDKVFHYLDEAVAERHPYLVLANVEPVFDGIRSDPRFAAILDKVNLPR